MPSVPLALIALSALANRQDQRLYVIGGGIRALPFTAFPATLPRLALALGLEFTAAESQTPQHSLKIEVTGPDDQSSIKPVTASFNIAPDAEHPDDPVYFHFVYNMENATLPVEGTYVFAVSVDDQPMCNVPLRARKIAGPVPTAVAAQAKLNEGYAAFMLGDLDAARVIFQEAVSEFPSVAVGHNNLGFVMLAQGQAEAAQSAFAKARELNFHQPEILDANVACAHYLMGDPVSASIFFQQCLRTRGFNAQGVLLGIHESKLFVVQLHSAADYVALMMLNAAWSALRGGDKGAAVRYLEGANASDLARRDDESGRSFAQSVQTLRAELA